jgi:hypothetical protein
VKLRKRDTMAFGEPIPCWHLQQWCPCGEVVGYTVTLPLDLFDHARLNWRDIAARRLWLARREIREHIARDMRPPRPKPELDTAA